jgi:hypothetical protein
LSVLAEAPLLVLLHAAYHLGLLCLIQCGLGKANVPRLEVSTVTACVVVEVLRRAVSLSPLGVRLPFLPLLIVSGFCALTLLAVWVRLHGDLH